MLLAWAAADALACLCRPGVVEVRPEDGATGVATDAAPFLVFNQAPGLLRLLDEGTGAEVPVTIEQSTEGEQSVVRVVPVAPLEPLHTYVVDGDAWYGLVRFPSAFTTGQGPDAEPPGPVALTDVGGGDFGDSDCGYSLHLIPELGEAPADAFYEAQIAWAADFSGAATVSRADRDDVFVGLAACNGTTVPELQRGDEVWLRARAVDLSGNVGPWSEPFHVERVRRVRRGPVGPGGCDSTGAHAVGLGALVLLVRPGRRRA